MGATFEFVFDRDRQAGDGKGTGLTEPAYRVEFEVTPGSVEFNEGPGGNRVRVTFVGKLKVKSLPAAGYGSYEIPEGSSHHP